MNLPAVYILDFGSIEKLEGKLLASAEEALDTRGVLGEIQTDIFRIEKSVFSSGGRRGGGSWKVLQDSTIKRKGSTSILRDTDALYNSLTEPDAPFQILDITNNVLVFGTDRPWAIVHQEGSSAAGIPRRPFLKFTAYDINRWSGMILRHLIKPFV